MGPPDVKQHSDRTVLSGHPGVSGETTSQRDARVFLLVALSSLMVLGLSLVAVLLMGYPADAPFVDLGSTDTVRGAPSLPPPPQALRVVVAAVTSPATVRAPYEDLTEYLGRRLERSAVLDQPSTYAAANEMLRSGAADVGFICTLAYVEGHEGFGLRLLAVPQVNGNTQYRSLVVVPASSSARHLDDLKGSIFAYTDPLSFSGYLAARYLLVRSGHAPESFFRRTTFTGSHDRSVRAVAQGLVDGAAVDSLVYEAMKARQPELGARVRVIAMSDPVGNPPVVVGPHVPVQLADRLKRVLLGMHEDPEGRRVLAELGIDRFVEAEDKAYDPIRRIRSFIGSATRR